MRILKYKFTIPSLIVDGDEIIECEPKEETYTFTLLFKGVDLFEKLTGKALLTELAKMGTGNEEDMIKRLDVAVIKNLAKASYCKIEGDAFHQNMATAEEFTKTSAYQLIGTDTDFMVALLQMAVDCCISSKPTKGGNPTKK